DGLNAAGEREASNLGAPPPASAPKRTGALASFELGIERSTPGLAEFDRVAALAVVLRREDDAVAHRRLAVMARAARLAGHDVLHGEGVRVELLRLLEDLVVVAIVARMPCVEVELVI